jgi:hypothetical protein
MVYISNAPLRNESRESVGLGLTEGMFYYDSRDNDDKPFDMGFATQCTKDWWGETHGEDEVKVTDSKVIWEDGCRTFFVIHTVPMYKRERDGKMVNITELNK